MNEWMNACTVPFANNLDSMFACTRWQFWKCVCVCSCACEYECIYVDPLYHQHRTKPKSIDCFLGVVGWQKFYKYFKIYAQDVRCARVRIENSIFQRCLHVWFETIFALHSTHYFKRRERWLCRPAAPHHRCFFSLRSIPTSNDCRLLYVYKQIFDSVLFCQLVLATTKCWLGSGRWLYRIFMGIGSLLGHFFVVFK